MDILWHIESGDCAWCGGACDDVRGHSDGRRYTPTCFSCWDAQQDGCILSFEEWEDDTVYVFHSKDDPSRKHPVGTAQGAFPN